MGSGRIQGRPETLQNQFFSYEEVSSVEPRLSTWVFGLVYALGPRLPRLILSDEDKLPLPRRAFSFSSSWDMLVILRYKILLNILQLTLVV